MGDDDFLRSILADPGDDAPRLVYADWLEEYGDEVRRARATFIRLQCQAARLPERRGSGRRALEKQAWQLLRRHRAAWLPAVPGGSGLRFGEEDGWERGFPVALGGAFEEFLRHHEHYFRLAPIQSLTLRNVSPDGMRSLVGLPALDWVDRLSLFGHFRDGIGANGLEPLAASPRLKRLRSLYVKEGKIGPASLGAVGHSPNLPLLESLSVPHNAVRDAGARALARSPLAARLSHLDLYDNKITDKGVSALSQAPLDRVTSLELGGGKVTDEGVRRLCEAPWLGRLTSLGLGNNEITDAGARALAAAGHLDKLRSLTLRTNAIGDAGVRALAQAPQFASLRELDLAWADIGTPAAKALAASPYLAKLEDLVLDNCEGVGPAGRKALIERFGEKVWVP